MKKSTVMLLMVLLLVTGIFVKINIFPSGTQVANEVGEYTGDEGLIYEGEYKDNLFHGQGKIKFGNGIFYEGNFEQGMRQGRGKLEFADGEIIEAIFEKDKMVGDKKAYYPEELMESIDQIESKEDINGSQGKLIYANGGIYEGEYKDGLPNGQGKSKG